MAKIEITVSLPADMSVPRQDVTTGNGTHTISSAFRQGFLDGLETPHELTSGMTYDNKALSEAYDEGANLGQVVGLLFGAVEEYRPDPPRDAD